MQSQALATAAARAGAQIGPAPEPSEMERVLARLTNLVLDAGETAGRLGNIVTRAGAPYVTPSSANEIKAPDDIPGALQRLHTLLDRLEIAQQSSAREVAALDRFF